MIKFIIEVDEEYIHKNASKENLEKMEKEDKSLLIALFSMIAFSAIEKEIDKGTKEFVINPANFDEGDERLYDHCLPDVCMLSIHAKKGDDKE